MAVLGKTNGHVLVAIGLEILGLFVLRRAKR